MEARESANKYRATTNGTERTVSYAGGREKTDQKEKKQTFPGDIFPSPSSPPYDVIPRTAES